VTSVRVADARSGMVRAAPDGTTAAATQGPEARIADQSGSGVAGRSRLPIHSDLLRYRADW